METQKRVRLFCEEISQHRWIVWGAVPREKTLVLGCSQCHAMGVVTDANEIEWQRAVREPHEPYPWHFNERVEEVTCLLRATKNS